MIYRDLLGDDPRTTFLLAVVSKRREDFPDLEEVYPQGLNVIVSAGGRMHRFRIPLKFFADVAMMEDILTSGMSAELEDHIAKVLGRE